MQKRGHGEAIDPVDAQAIKVLEAARVRPFAGRLKVMVGLMSAPPSRALTACELHRELICARRPVALSSVYASLKVLAEHGLVQGCVERPGAYRLAPGVSSPP